MFSEEQAKKLAQEIVKAVSECTITLHKAKCMIAVAEKKSQELGVAMTITVLDAGGNLVAQHRMDHALLGSIPISRSKAYTAVQLQLPTAELHDKAALGGPLYGIHTLDGGSFCVFGGGFPVYAAGRLIGGIGVSGGSVEQDILVGQTALSGN